MKKYIYILAAVAALTACSKEANIADKNTPEETKISGKTVSFSVSVEKQDIKSSLSGSGFTWASSDRAAVYTTGGEKVILTPSNIDGANAIFSGTITDDNDGIPEGAIIVYPADRLTAATTVDFTPKVFNTADAPDAEPILAAKVGSDRTELKFKYVCGTVQIPFADIPCAANKIYIQQVSGSLGGNGVISFIDHDSNSSTDEVPSYSGSFADNVDIYLTSWGHKTVFLPVLNTATRDLYVSLKDENVLLFDKIKSLTVQRNSYFKMKELSVSPNVYLYSNMTGWSGTDAPMTVNNGVASLKLTSMGSQYFRVAVEMSGNTYVYGATGADITSLPATLVLNGTSKAAKVSDDLGVYTISFDYTTAEASVDAESDVSVFYIVGTENSWNLSDASTTLSKTYDGKYYVIGQKGQYKVCYNPYWASTIGTGSDTNGGNFGPGAQDSDTGSSSLIMTIPSDGSAATYNYFNEDYQSTASHTAVYVKINNSNDGLAMTQDSYNKSLWTYEYTNTDTHYVTFWVDALWGTDSSLSTTEYNGVGATHNSYYGVDNWCIGGMKYLIVLNDHTGKVKYLKLPN